MRLSSVIRQLVFTTVIFLFSLTGAERANASADGNLRERTGAKNIGVSGKISTTEYRLDPNRLDGASVTVETPRFRFVATPRAEGLAESLSRDVEKIRDRIASDLGRDYDGITEIRVADRHSSFQALQPHPRGAPSWAVGVAWSSFNIVVINGGHGRSLSDIRRTLAHEISHIALGRLAPGRFPRWFLEGMAIYHSEEWNFERAGSIAGALLRDGIIPLKDLDRGWPDTPSEVRLAYAQSIDFVGWLFRNYGKESIHRLVDHVVEGDDFETAIEKATKIPFWKLEYEWKSGLPVRYTWIPALTSGGFIWVLTSILFLAAYARKRRIKKKRLADMEEEELWIHGPEKHDNYSEYLDEKTEKKEGMNGSSRIVPW